MKSERSTTGPKTTPLREGLHPHHNQYWLATHWLTMGWPI